MSGKYKELSGRRFGNLTVVKATKERTKQGNVIWECQCDCGNVTFVSTCSLKGGNTQSCGCLRLQRITRHRECNTRLYSIWHGMKYRCNNPNARKFKFYGGRGITVCNAWQQDFTAFRDWALGNGYNHGLTLDRINSDGNYEPLNCRWVDSTVQNNNRRMCRNYSCKPPLEAIKRNIYCGMRMENRAVTFPQTKTILDGVNVPNVRLDDIQAILNMRDAWRFLLGSIGDPLDLDYLCKLNGYIARNEALEWGKLRTGTVGISGTDYEPPVPDREKVVGELAAILSADTTATEKALNVFTWGARSQLFWDGNKRTSLVAANKILIGAGAGMLTIKEANMQQFNDLLVDYYNTGEPDKVKAFLYENAIEGLTV